MRKILTAVFAGALLLGAYAASAAEPASKTVAQLNQEKQALAGQLVQVQGKVVKVNNGIMGRNFVHVQDGTGEQGSNKVIATSKQAAKVGDPVVITGLVVLDRDFGSGTLTLCCSKKAPLLPAIMPGTASAQKADGSIGFFVADQAVRSRNVLHTRSRNYSVYYPLNTLTRPS